MNFQRGIDPKEALQIGIMERAREVIKRLMQENILELRDRKTLDKMEKQFKEEVGLDIDIKPTMDRENLDFHVHINRSISQIENTIIISPWYDKLLDEI